MLRRLRNDILLLVSHRRSLSRCQTVTGILSRTAGWTTVSWLEDLQPVLLLQNRCGANVLFLFRTKNSATDQKMPCCWLTAAYINSCVSCANLRICSLAFLSPVDREPQQPAVESNSSKLISFCPCNLIKHKPFPSYSPSVLPSLRISWWNRYDSEEMWWRGLSVCDERKAPWGLLWSMTKRPGSFWMYACVTAY